MNDYRLDRLDPRLFEHMVQTLAVSAIASTVTPFGDGPDAGREATFEGATHYGAEGAYWDGKGIIQAKFHVRPQDTARDAAWARSQLSKELQQYDRKTKPRPAPEYFIYATNVVLSPGEGQGKDSVLAILRDFAQRHRLKGVDLWDYDKLRTLLDLNQAVRTSYMAWILPSDVLAALNEKLRTSHREYYPLIIRYLQREIIADQFAKLEQAGHSADDRIPLAQVFIDLPTSRHPPGSEYPDDGDDPGMRFVATVIHDAGYSLKSTEDADAKPSIRGSHAPGGIPGRYVLIGGPGQGKTTIGQYVCQIFRHALLADVPPNLLSGETQTAMQGLSRQWGHDRIPEPRARRLPFRIVLGDLARCLADNEASSLPDYLALRFNANSATRVTGAEIERILSEYPSLIVLDGLDEVPSSTNREAVMSAVSAFLIDVAAGSLDVLVLATSRPQGYNDDFSPRLYSHHYLLPLSTDDAMKYGRQLAKTRFGDGNERYSKVADRLERALLNPATARLMESPLQVTILTLLVDRIGTPPEERWALFSAYYNLIFERETERDIDSVAVLKTNRVDVDEIHRRVGLVLQVESERSGGTDARLTVEQFSDMVESYLVEEGHQEPGRAQLKRQIIEAAGNRLVFLVGLESGQVGFEIRSLQEFMAAEGLMAGRDQLVQERLGEVASSTNWRNVFLFAAGQCFAARRYLRDTIESICVDLNEDDDEPLRKLKVGSLLALDLLEDGPARKQPIKRRSLTRLAAQLLSIPRQEARRIALVSEEDTFDIYEEQIRELLTGQDVFKASSAWSCLVTLIELHGGRFEQLGREVLTTTPLDSFGFHSAVPLASGRNEWLSSVLCDYVRDHGPILEPEVSRIFSRPGRPREFGPWRLDKQPPWLAWFGKYSETIWQAPPRRSTVRLDASGRTIKDIELNSMLGRGPAALIPPPKSPTAGNWAFIHAAGLFCSHPRADYLAAAVRAFSHSRPTMQYNRLVIRSYPWPLAECLHASFGRSTDELAEFVESGGYGEHEHWIAHEEAWRDGISVQELASMPPLLAGPDGDGVLFAFPFQTAGAMGSRINTIGRDLIDAFEAARSKIVREFFAETLLYGPHRRRLAGRSASDAWIDQAMKLYVAGKPYLPGVFYDWIEELDLANPEWADIFDAADPFMLVQRLGIHRPVAATANVLLAALDQGPAFQGLVVPLANALVSLDPKRRRILVRRMSISSDAAPAVQLAALMIDIIAGVSVKDISSRIEAVVRINHRLLEPILHSIVLRDLSYKDESRELMVAISIADANYTDWLTVLGQNFSRRRSRLGDPRVWSQLQLPAGVLGILDNRRPIEMMQPLSE